MALYIAPLTLQNVLEQKGDRILKKKNEVLFRRGENAFGMFVVLRGIVSLDFGVDSPLSRSYGPGALVGLPATLTRTAYRMTATVIEDAELSYWSFDVLKALLRKRKDFCEQLLTILGQKMAENQALAKSLAYGVKYPPQGSYVV
jgi:CRP-like cAMP-binding protein